MLAQVLFSGVALGSLYGLIALGFVIVFKATEVFNFAQGMLAVCGAYFAAAALSTFGWPFPAAIAFMAVGSAALGVVIYIALIQPLGGRSMLAVIMMTIALSIVLRAAIEVVFGSQGRTLSTPLPSGVIAWGTLRISELHVTAAAVAWVCMALFGGFFRFTSVGLLMRATADGHEAALASGVNVDLMQRLAWGVGSLLAAIGGLFLGQLQIVSTGLESIGLLALPAVVIGGLQSIPGAVIGGVMVGLIEQLAAFYISPEATDIVIYALLLLILLIRPWGLFGEPELGRV